MKIILETTNAIIDKAYEKIKALSNQDLIEIHDTLNCWKWDDRLGKKPEDWDTMPHFKNSFCVLNFHKISKKAKTKHNIIKPLMECIELTIPQKAILRYHHLHNLGRTEQQFEDWWQSEHLFKP